MFVVVLQNVCAVFFSDVYGDGPVVSAFEAGGSDGQVAVNDGIGEGSLYLWCGVQILFRVNVGIVCFVFFHDVVKVKVGDGQLHGCERVAVELVVEDT